MPPVTDTPSAPEEPVVEDTLVEEVSTPSAPEEPVVEDTLVEEVSIDGMCGVY